MARQIDEYSIYKKLLVVYIGYLLLLTLNPYDFSMSYFKHLMSFNTGNLIKFIFHLNLWDILLNILLFIPFGIFVYEITKNKKSNNVYSAPVFYAFVLSFSIEIIQLFLERSTSIIDLATNTFGSFIGAYLSCRHGASLFQSIRRFSVQMKRAYRIVLAYLFLLFLMIIALIPYFLNNTRDWLDSYPVVFGNEITGNRPWTGVLEKVIIYDKSFSKSEIGISYKNGAEGKFNISGIKRAGGIAFYDFSLINDSSQLNEILYKSIDLNLKGSNFTILKNGVEFAGKGMLASSLGAKKITDRIQKTNCFTVEAWLKTSDFSQTGPARIVSVSNGPDERNFTLAQMGRDVHLRVRTLLAGRNGSRICLRAKNVLNDTLTHQIVATFNRGVERIAVDGKYKKDLIRGDIDFIPFILRLGTNGFSEIAFCFLFLVPLGILFYSLGEPLREERLIGIMLIYIFLVQLFYYFKAGQPFGINLFAEAVLAIIISIYLGSSIKKANKNGFLNK